MTNYVTGRKNRTRYTVVAEINARSRMCECILSDNVIVIISFFFLVV